MTFGVVTFLLEVPGAAQKILDASWGHNCSKSTREGQ